MSESRANAENALSRPLESNSRVPTIQEFWIDLLLEEEFAANIEFTQSVVTACCLPGRVVVVDRVQRSFVDAFGEADLFVACRARQSDGESVRYALLVENKIRAGFQPDQAKRYRQRGEAGKPNQWNEYRTLLIAPKSYLARGHAFDTGISLEQIAGWLCPGDQPRREHKQARIQDAITRASTTGVHCPDLQMTAFRHAYYDHVQDFNRIKGSDFTMRTPAPTYVGDTWIILKSAQLPAKSYLRHRCHRGHSDPGGDVDLTFESMSVSQLEGIEGVLQSGMSLVATGSHKQNATIRIEIEPIKEFGDFDNIRHVVERALGNAKRLVELFHAERATFSAAFARSGGR